MDRILLRDVVERELVVLAVEAVAAVLNPVRPRDQNLPAPRAAHLVHPVAVEQLAAVERVLPQAATDLHDDRPLFAMDDLVLSTRGCDQGSVSSSSTVRWSSVYSSARAGTTRTRATPNTTSNAVSVSLEAAPSAIVSFWGSR